jgi:hypothetical protein
MLATWCVKNLRGEHARPSPYRVLFAGEARLAREEAELGGGHERGCDARRWFRRREAKILRRHEPRTRRRDAFGADR